MTLTKGFIEHQVKTLGVHARKALEEYNDPALTERTVIFDQLKACGGLNRQHDSEVIANTIVNVIETRAWEDYIDVDGSRSSCESFTQWVYNCQVDIKLAEWCIKEKRNDAYGKFLEARDGELVDSQESLRLGRLSRWAGQGQDRCTTHPERKAPRSKLAAARLRLEKAAKTDPQSAELLLAVTSGERTITSVAKQLGWIVSDIRRQSGAVLTFAAPQAKPLIKKLGIAPEEFVKLALEEYIQNHYPESSET